MTRRAWLLSVSLLAISFAAAGTGQELKPPAAAVHPKESKVHGVTLHDDYSWLREKSNPQVIKHLEAENAYTQAVMKPRAELQETLYKEMLGRIKQTDLSVPSRIGEHFYYSRTQEGKQYPILCRRKGSMQNPEQVLLDLNALAAGQKFMSLGTYTVSDDGNWLAFSTDPIGYRQYTLQVKDLRSGALSSERIERVGSVVWARDNRTIFYTTEDPVSKRSDRFWRHVVGASKSDLIFEEEDQLFDVFVRRSLDKAMIFLTSYAKTSREVRYVPADTPAAPLRMVMTRQPGHEYDVDHYENRFYITTNKGAKNFRVVTAPIDDPSEKNWKPFIEHQPGLKIDGITFFASHFVVEERDGGLSYLRVVDAKTNQSHRITTDEPDYALSLGSNPEFNTGTLRFTYQSMVTPPSVYDYDMTKRTRTLLKRQDVLGGYDPAKYEARRIWSVSRDGTKVPISIVHRKGLAMDGRAPMLLTAYGSYGASLSPTFSSNRLSLLDRGAIYALAYIRGGGELGEEWREQGRMLQKLNTFYDFIDCADYLVKNKYTSSDRLVIHGVSAGGLLVGAAMNMRPNLFKAVVAQVPFVDVMNSMLDPSLPLTTSEFIEWGNPAASKAEFDYILRYSPYDNIKAQSYPATLVLVSLNDSQVPYWEGAKFAAKLRATKTDDHIVLLKANLAAGHGGSSGRYDLLRETALTYTFVLWQMGVVKQVPAATSANR